MHSKTHLLIIILSLILLGLIAYICIRHKQLKDDQEEYYRQVTLQKLATGTVDTVKGVSDYASQKWHDLKIELKKRYRDDLIRKLFKFLNNSDLIYLGKNQDIVKYPYLIKRKTITNYASPSLLQILCMKVKENKQKAKQWLIDIISNNIDDYLYEQWKLKSTIYRAILSLGQNFGFLTADDILKKYMLEVINNDYSLILERLMKFENKDGINICSGKKKSFISSIFSE